MTETPQQAARRLSGPALEKGFKPEALYTYRNADGSESYHKIRARHPDSREKWIRPMHKNGSGYQLGEPPFPNGKPLYRLQELIAKPGNPCWYVEGENCADALAELGVLATTAGSATSDEKADYSPLAKRAVVIWPDNDAAGMEHGRRVADRLRAIGCNVEIIDARALGLPDGGDCVNWLEERPFAEVKDLATLPRAREERRSKSDGPVLEAASGDQDSQEIARLARLSSIEYDREREKAAERLGIRATTLDAEVKRARGEATDEGAGEAVIFPERQAWPDPVNGADLLEELARTFRRFIVLPDTAEDGLALWVLMTYFADVVSVAPILAITSPEKRCGKSNLLALLGRLTHRPLTASNIRPAALFRAVEKWAPTLLIDEADTFVREDDELRGVLNSGHTRDSAFVIRTVGDDHEPRRFSTWGPKSIALIGTLPDTLADRSIAIELRRKLPSERVEKLRHAGDFEPIAKRCLRFAQDSRETIRRARPTLLEDLNDRAADNWEPLLAIADAADGGWPARARKAASVLSGATPDGDSTKVELLRDIRRLMDGDEGIPGRFAARSAIGSAELVEALTEDKAGRWHEFKHGKPLTQPQLARLLRPFSIVPRSVRLVDSTPKGYPVDGFKDAFARYLPSFKPPHRHNPINTGLVADRVPATDQDVLRSSKAPQANENGPCGGVAVQKPPEGEQEQF